MTPFIQLGLVLLIVFLISIILRLLKQPLIIGYIISGILIGPSVFNAIQEPEMISFFSELGIALLLFLVGLHLSPKVIKEVGKVSLITGLFQIAITWLLAFIISVAFDFNMITSVYIAIALTFSSTIIIMKLLSDKDALEKLYGKIAVGILLIQDIIAILLLTILPSLSSESAFGLITITILKGILILSILFLFSYYVLPKFNKFFGKSQEFLFLFAIVWAISVSILFQEAGFSIEIGALFSGVLLSITPYSYEISSKLKPLRDFFLIFFFITLGSQIILSDISSMIVPAIIFSLFVFFGKPIIIVSIMGLLGYSKNTSFMTGSSMAQISEFSLILVGLGVKLGVLSQDILSFITLIGLITIAGSTYLIQYSEKIYKKISKFLLIFEKKRITERQIPEKQYKYILFGYNRIGFSILKSLSKITKDFLIVDYDPEIIKDLNKKKIPNVYGDADNVELLEDLKISNAKLIISTIPEKETNKLINEVIKSHDSKTIFIATARQIHEAEELYGAGVDYVILPHFLGGEHISKVIETYKTSKKGYEKERKKELKLLEERKKRGFEHPNIEKNR